VHGPTLERVRMTHYGGSPGRPTWLPNHCLEVAMGNGNVQRISTLFSLGLWGSAMFSTTL
jgi:hypothetical protein